MSTYANRTDEHVMRILSGATFGPNARVTLPSGKMMSSDEMTWNAEADGQPSPLHSENDQWTGDPDIDRAALVARSLAASPPAPARRSRPASVGCDIYDVLGAMFALALFVGLLKVAGL